MPTLVIECVVVCEDTLPNYTKNKRKTMYKNKNLQRETTRIRVKKWRNAHIKKVTPSVTPETVTPLDVVTPLVTPTKEVIIGGRRFNVPC